MSEVRYLRYDTIVTIRNLSSLVGHFTFLISLSLRPKTDQTKQSRAKQKLRRRPKSMCP